VPDISRFYYSATAGFGYDYSWLSQAVLFGAYRWLGGAGIAILSSAVAGFIFYVFYKLLQRNSENMLVNFVVLCLALVTTTVYLTGRPMMFTVAFFALEVLILSGWAESSSSEPAGRSRSRLIWLIPPMTALWANLHPGFAVAPLLILLFLPLGREPRDRWTLAACLATTVAAVVLNPYGPRMYLMPLETVRSMSMLRGLAEWTGVSGTEAVIWGGLVALVTCGLSLRRQPLPVLLLAAVTAPRGRGEQSQHGAVRCSRRVRSRSDPGPGARAHVWAHESGQEVRCAGRDGRRLVLGGCDSPGAGRLGTARGGSD